jgi:hypothetical protein
LRFHEEFIAHYGASHAIITKCFHAARKAGIASSDNQISKKLISWSKQIQDDFIKRNIDIHTNTNDERLLAKLVEEMSKQNHLSTQVVQLTTAVIKNQEDLKSRLANSEVVFEAANIAVQQRLSALEGLLYERKKSPASQSLTGQKRTRIETDFNQQQNESSSAMSSKTDLVFQMDLETKAAPVKETKAFWQLQNIPSDIPTDTKSLQIKHLLKYHYDSKHFHTSNFGNFSLISTPPFYSARDTGKHTNLMKLLQIVWDDDTEKFSGLFYPNLEATQLASICASFQQKVMDTMIKLEISLKSFDSEKDREKAASKSRQSSRLKPYALGVANRFASYCEAKLSVEGSQKCQTNLKKMLGKNTL